MSAQRFVRHFAILANFAVILYLAWEVILTSIAVLAGLLRFAWDGFPSVSAFALVWVEFDLVEDDFSN